MPLPWKKTRISRISRLMADLQPSKSCNSMVVQTGFPTSLVDLFVKNCDRLTKPSKKKNHQRHHHNNHHQPRPAKAAVSVFDPGAGVSPSEDPVNLNNNQFKRKENSDCVYKSADRFEINHESDEGLNGGSFVDTGCYTNREGRGVLYAVFMVSVVASLALIGIKIFTLAITMSACVLIFLEYFGKHILFFIGPCSRYRIALQSPFCLCKKDKREEVTTEAKEEYKEDRVELNSPGEEIQVAEARFDENEGTHITLLSGRWGYSDMEVEGEEEGNECEVITKRHRKSSREFIKKLVPKKWRAMKKKARKGKEETEEYAGSEEDKSGNNEEIEELLNSDSEQRLTELLLKEEEHKLCGESETKLNKKEDPVVKKEGTRGSYCSFLLLVVALAGLAGGRILSLGLTVVSCVIIQLVIIRRGQKQCVKKKKKKKKKKTLSSKSEHCLCFIQ